MQTTSTKNTKTVNKKKKLDIILKYKRKPTEFGATVNKTDFAVAIRSIQLENPTLVIKLWLRRCFCTLHNSNLLCCNE